VSKVVYLHAGRAATQLAVSDQPVARATRLLCTQYWRRQRMIETAGHRLNALDVFDTSIVQSLVIIKEHLLHDAIPLEGLLRLVRDVEGEIKQPSVTWFASTCLGALMVQLSRAQEINFWPECAQGFARFPAAIIDGLRFCFDATVGNALADELQRPNSPWRQAELMGLPIALGVARPAVSERFAQIAASIAHDAPGGRAALCEWRCTGTAGSVPKALASLNGEIPDADAALYALALMDSDQELTAARAVLAQRPSLTALAVCAGRAPEVVHAELRAGQLSTLGAEPFFYLAALLGDWRTLLDQADSIDWSDENQCRALADAVALVTGTVADYLFDIPQPGEKRHARLLESAQSLALPPDTLLRLGQAKASALLEDSAAIVGAPLRHMLYVEYACNMQVPVFVDATDLAGVQSLALTTASAWERFLIERTKK